MASSKEQNTIYDAMLARELYNAACALSYDIPQYNGISEKISNAYEAMHDAVRDTIISLMQSSDIIESDGVKQISIRGTITYTDRYRDAFFCNISATWSHNGILFVNAQGQNKESYEMKFIAPEFDIKTEEAQSTEDRIQQLAKDITMRNYNAVLTKKNRVMMNYMRCLLGAPELNIYEKLTATKSKYTKTCKQLEAARDSFARWNEIEQDMYDYCIKEAAPKFDKTNMQKNYQLMHNFMNHLHLHFPELANDAVQELFGSLSYCIAEQRWHDFMEAHCSYKGDIPDDISLRNKTGVVGPTYAHGITHDMFTILNVTHRDRLEINIDSCTYDIDYALYYDVIRYVFENSELTVEIPTKELYTDIVPGRELSEQKLQDMIENDFRKESVCKIRQTLPYRTLNELYDANANITDELLEETIVDKYSICRTNNTSNENESFATTLNMLNAAFDIFKGSQDSRQLHYNGTANMLLDLTGYASKLLSGHNADKNQIIEELHSHMTRNDRTTRETTWRHNTAKNLPIDATVRAPYRIFFLQKDQILHLINDAVWLIKQRLDIISQIQQAYLRSDDMQFLKWLADRKIIGKKDLNARLKELEKEKK